MTPIGHTPGPWYAAVTSLGAFQIHTTPGTDVVVICSRSDWGHRVEQSTANAFLISAAPDLFAALVAIVTEIRAYQSPECDDPGATGAAAIARARGRVP